MSGKQGSSNLNPEQRKGIHDMFGIRYTAVQTNATIASRKERRKRGQRGTLGRGSMTVPH